LSYAGLSETEAEPKECVDVTIADATEYDLIGKGLTEQERRFYR